MTQIDASAYHRLHKISHGRVRYSRRFGAGFKKDQTRAILCNFHVLCVCLFYLVSPVSCGETLMS